MAGLGKIQENQSNYEMCCKRLFDLGFFPREEMFRRVYFRPRPVLVGVEWRGDRVWQRNHRLQEFGNHVQGSFHHHLANRDDGSSIVDSRKREGGKMRKWEDGKMGKREDEKMGKWEDEKMGKWEDGKMGIWEDEKMRAESRNQRIVVWRRRRW